MLLYFRSMCVEIYHYAIHVVQLLTKNKQNLFVNLKKSIN